MRSVAPRTGAPEVSLGRDQHEWAELTAARYVILNTREVWYVSRWRLDDEERAKIAAGEDLFLSVVTFGGPVQPVALSVGEEDWMRVDG